MPGTNMTGDNNIDLTYMAYPVGQFYQYDLTKGRVLKEVTLDSQGRVVKKIVNDYSSGFNSTLYGLNVQRFIDSPAQNPGYFDATRYLISMSSQNFGLCWLQKSTTTNYFPDSGTSIAQEQSFGYAGSESRLKSVTTTINNNETSVTEYVYPDGITIPATGLSAQATTLKQMKDRNLINIPVQVTKRKGGKYVEGSYTTFKQLSNGAIVPDTLFNLNSQLETYIPNPVIDANGRIIRHGNFAADKEILEYDLNANPVTIKAKDNIPITYKWGYGGQYPIAKIINYTQAQLVSNINLLNQLESLTNYTAITDANRAGLSSTNQAIRSSLPDKMITTYTYNPLIGMTSASDQLGVTTHYGYDTFNRISLINDNENNIINRYQYAYSSTSGAQGGYSLTTTLSSNASNYALGSSGTANGTVTGGSGSYTYNWYLKDSADVVIGSSLNTSSATYGFTCSQRGPLTIQCTITDNITGQTSTKSKTILCYPTLTVTVATDASSYLPNNSGTATAYVSGGSGNYTYNWFLRNSYGNATLSNSTITNSFPFTCTDTGALTMECQVYDNLTGETVPGSISIFCNTHDPNEEIYTNFNISYGEFTTLYNSLYVYGYQVSFDLGIIANYNSINVGTNVLIATVPQGVQPDTPQTLTYYSDGRTWQLTFNPDTSVVIQLLDGPTLQPGNALYVNGSYQR